jgi:receptor expression-enhancing protein 1/2/3/4
MVSAVISRVVILIFGTLYPAYASYKAVKTKNVKEYVKWMMYWIVFACFTFVETFADIFIAWLPFYYEIKILFVLWLLSPATKGASILYRKFIHPQLAKREKEIDTYISKASDQGYTALLNLGSKGFNYATNVVLTTAIKGQSKIADHLKKSYSLGDLSEEPDNRKFHDDSETESLDDETDNRIIEEQYRQEMQEKVMTEETKSRRRRGYAQEPDLQSVEEAEEENRARTEKEERAKKYSHKEPALEEKQDHDDGNEKSDKKKGGNKKSEDKKVEDKKSPFWKKWKI